MIVVDTNILIYAHREDSPWHEKAYAAIERLAEGKAPWAIPWPCVHEFLAISTHTRLFNPPTPLSRALNQIDAWMDSPSVHLIAEQPRYWESLRPLLAAGKISGPAVHDGRVAAICLQHGVRELWTADRDFGRFAALRVRNPLA